MSGRSSGILLHITSLPGKEGIGSLGADAYQFIDFLSDAGQKLWQILPLGPVGYGDSPYQCYSAFAGNLFLIDLHQLCRDSLLEESDLKRIPKFNVRQVEFDKVLHWKSGLLKIAFDNYKNHQEEKLSDEYNRFIEEHGWWLNDYALFIALKKQFSNKIWNEWDDDIKYRKPKALKKYRILLKDEIEFRKFIQFIFFRQWFKLKDYANSKGIQIIGDMPLYVSIDSSDVWTNTDLFLLDKNYQPTHVGGVPPDYFSDTGQLWGCPVYNWKKVKARDFDWWIARMHFNFKLFDQVRIDHFRGFESFWSVEVTEKTAEKGEWVKAKGYELLSILKSQIGELPLIAEDLGIITPEVESLRDDFNLPGMKVLQFAFPTDETNEFLPHNYSPNFAVYTGTHDNDTTWAWFRSNDKKMKRFVRNYLDSGSKGVVKSMIEACWGSVAKISIIPLQDIFELGAEGRMNIPGTPSGNWGWRFRWKQLKKSHIQYLNSLTKKYNRKD